tara:strand:+ start:1179 stop:1523 length:345 start_codon:yes stop_codon:yes gene_type:complete
MTEAYIYLGISMFALMYLLIKGIGGTEEPFWKALLFIPLSLIIVAMIQIATLLIQAEKPGLTGVISILDSLYIGSIVLIIPLIILLFCYIVYQVVNKIFNQREKRDADWDKWQK